MTSGGESGDLVLERHGSILILRLNRPDKRNAMTPGMRAGIGLAVRDAELDPGTRVVVLTGTGDRAFCAGMDLKSYAEGNQGSDDDPGRGDFKRLMRGEVSMPIVCAANGTAVAGGFELALACDIVVAAEGALFGLSEVKRGLIPGGNGTFLGCRIPLVLAMELNLIGDTIDAPRLYELGLVNAVVPPGDVLARAMAFAERIAANAPLAVAAAKELVRTAASEGTTIRDRLEVLRQEIFDSEDSKEGSRAFLEKRPPVWLGR